MGKTVKKMTPGKKTLIKKSQFCLFIQVPNCLIFVMFHTEADNHLDNLTILRVQNEILEGLEVFSMEVELSDM